MQAGHTDVAFEPRSRDAAVGAAAEAAEAALRARLEALMLAVETGGDAALDGAAFEALALAIFAHQFAHDPAYRRFCRGRGRAPRTVRSWRDIPAVPISAFKAAELGLTPPERAERCFMTSGTTGANTGGATGAGARGRVHHRSLALYDRSMRLGFARFFMRGSGPMPMATLFPDEDALPHSSLAHYLALARRHFGAPGSRALIGENGLDLAALVEALRGAEATGRPFALLGASAALAEMLAAMAAEGLRVRLPPGSRVLDTGGFKGARAVPADAFYAGIEAALGVPASLCVNMYGMTELSSQFYDSGNAAQPATKRSMPWLRARVVDPLTGRDLPPGTPGVLLHHDLAHLGVVSAILTEDLGVADGDGGFVLLGRAAGAEAKGCSLALSEFLDAARAPA